MAGLPPMGERVAATGVVIGLITAVVCGGVWMLYASVPSVIIPMKWFDCRADSCFEVGGVGPPTSATMLNSL